MMRTQELRHGREGVEKSEGGIALLNTLKLDFHSWSKAKWVAIMLFDTKSRNRCTSLVLSSGFILSRLRSFE